MPWMMEDIARHPDAESLIRPFDHVCFGGGEYLDPPTATNTVRNADSVLGSGAVMFCSRSLGQVYEHTKHVGGYGVAGCPTTHGG